MRNQLKIIVLSFLFLHTTVKTLSQQTKVVWGDDMKIKKGTTDMFVLHSDKTGVYVQEGGIRMTSYFVIGATYGEAVKIRKYDKTFEEVYAEDYNKELKGKDFNRVYIFKNRMFMFADDYDKKKKIFTNYMAEIDKETGKLLTDWQLMGTVSKEEKSDDYDFTILPSADSSKMVLVGNLSNKDRCSIGILVLDEKLKEVSRTKIELDYPVNSFVLQDVIYTPDQKILISGKIFEEIRTGKKNKKSMIFKMMSIEKYDLAGKKEYSLPTIKNDGILISAKLYYNKNNELYICGFYSNDAKSKEINGLLVSRIDPTDGRVMNTYTKPIDQSMISNTASEEVEDDDEDEKTKKSQRKKANDNDEVEGFSPTYIFKRVMIGMDNSVLLICEKYKYEQYSYTTTEYNSTTKSFTTQTVHVQNFFSGDLMTIRLLPEGEIKWINVIPKNQLETIKSSRSSSGSGIQFGVYNIFNFTGMPFYSSFHCIPYKNQLLYYFNDHSSNGNVTSTSQKVKRLTNMKKSECYQLSLDLETGVVKRKMIFSNEDEPIAMVRHGKLFGNMLYLVALKPKMLAKSGCKIGYISVK